MKIIQTFWSGNLENDSHLKISAGWLSPEYNWMSWALSCLLLRRHYEHVELYTDRIGKKVLIDILQLPYSDVHIVFDDSFKIHPKLFSLAKIYTYSLQEEPFLHIDGDVFLWKPFPDTFLDAELISSNLEVNLFFNKEILKEMEQSFNDIPEHLKEVYRHENIFASNAGIIGGSNISFIKQYCKEAFSLIKSNEGKLEKVNTGVLNNLIEQVSLFYLSQWEGVEIDYYISKPVDHPLYQDHWRFADVPDVEMIHPVGGCKKEPYVLDHLTKRLRLEYPEYYYKILSLCKNKNITLKTKLYKYLDLDNIKNIQNQSHFREILDPKISEMARTDFKVQYRRTLFAIDYHFSQTMHDFKELSSFVRNRDVPAQIRDIYNLESERNVQLKKLIEQVGKGEIYNLEHAHYKDTTNFFLTTDWTEKQVALKEGVKVMNLGWKWNFQIERDKKALLEEVFANMADNHLVTLNWEPLNLEIHETYHDGIDTLVLRCLEGSKSILKVLTEIKKFFEDDFSIDNPEYQRLIFDTLKRLSFSNIVTIG